MIINISTIYFFKSVHTLLLRPPPYPYTQKYAFGGTPHPPLKRTYFMDGPLQQCNPSPPDQSEPSRSANICPLLHELAHTPPNPPLDLHTYQHPPTSYVTNTRPISLTHPDLSTFAHLCPYIPKLAQTQPNQGKMTNRLTFSKGILN